MTGRQGEQEEEEEGRIRQPGGGGTGGLMEKGHQCCTSISVCAVRGREGGRRTERHRDRQREGEGGVDR